MSIAYVRWQKERNRFRKGLRQAGFAPGEASDKSECWEGIIDVEWVEPETQTQRTTSHPILIKLFRAFPYEKPSVMPLDGLQPIQNERHQQPGTENGALCLYPEQGAGWAPWNTAEEMLERVRTWFIHYHQNDWPLADQPPDLHMYYPSQSVRPLMIYGDDWHLPDGILAGRFVYWMQIEYNRAFAANPTALNALPGRYLLDRIAPVLQIARVSCTGYGAWFRLKREPIPCATLDGVLKDIDEAADQQSGWALQHLRALFGDRIRGKDRTLILALSYPVEHRQDWLFVKALLPASKKNDKRWSRRTPDIAIGSFMAASAGRTALMRRTGHIAQAFSGKTVCIFGIGSIGSSVAMLLGKAGVENLRLIDDDTLRPGNAVRHTAGLAYVGLLKVQCLQLEARGHFPDAMVASEHSTWNPDVLSKYITEADIIVDATASPAFSFLLNDLCVALKRPVVYVATYRRAIIGRVEVVRPGIDACLVCRAAYHANSEDYAHIPQGEDGAFQEDGCGVPTVEASAVDIEASANVAARAALHILAQKQGDGNECLIVNEPLDDATGLLRSPGHHWQTWQPAQDCETCASAQSF